MHRFSKHSLRTPKGIQKSHHFYDAINISLLFKFSFSHKRSHDIHDMVSQWLVEGHVRISCCLLRPTSKRFAKCKTMPLYSLIFVLFWKKVTFHKNIYVNM